MASACIPPDCVARARAAYPRLTLCTVIGFPLGYSTAETKLFELRRAIGDGADELDAVVNLGDVKSGGFARIQDELARLRDACGGKILKVIVETCFLTETDKIQLCRCVTRAGADFIKTSTGFGAAGADLADIALFRAHVGEAVRIKASGGIRTRAAMEAFLAAGCDRLGTSGAVAALEGA
jgi:deoxyribose-phosphate aldolase